MAKLKEPIARRANQEDDCKGRFWEGRFRSFAVLDESSIVAAAAYIDLNPLRAGVVCRPEEATHTSFPLRINLFKNPDVDSKAGVVPLTTIPGCSFKQYLQFVDHSAKVFIPGKRSMSLSMPPILDRLGLSASKWARLLKAGWDQLKGTAIGARDSLEREALRRGSEWVCSPLYAGRS